MDHTQEVASASQSKRQPEETVLLVQDLPNVAGKQLTLIHLQYPPGAANAGHRHPGFTLAYVLSGRVVSQVGEDPVRTYDTGEFFIEAPNEAHKISRNASDSSAASLLAVLISDTGAKLVEPLTV
jgi:quercetin dioxygenase-like cupin family protein